MNAAANPPRAGILPMIEKAHQTDTCRVLKTTAIPHVSMPFAGQQYRERPGLAAAFMPRSRIVLNPAELLDIGHSVITHPCTVQAELRQLDFQRFN